MWRSWIRPAPSRAEPGGPRVEHAAAARRLRRFGHAVVHVRDATAVVAFGRHNVWITWSACSGKQTRVMFAPIAAACGTLPPNRARHAPSFLRPRPPTAPRDPCAASVRRCGQGRRADHRLIFPHGDRSPISEARQRPRMLHPGAFSFALASPHLPITWRDLPSSTPGQGLPDHTDVLPRGAKALCPGVGHGQREMMSFLLCVPVYPALPGRAPGLSGAATQWNE